MKSARGLPWGGKAASKWRRETFQRVDDTVGHGDTAGGSCYAQTCEKLSMQKIECLEERKGEESGTCGQLNSLYISRRKIKGGESREAQRMNKGTSVEACWSVVWGPGDVASLLLFQDETRLHENHRYSMKSDRSLCYAKTLKLKMAERK